MVTDRPDFTESSLVVPTGVVQLEGGFTYEGEGRRRGVTVPGALLRFGLAPRVELRVGSDGWRRDRLGAVTSSGGADLELSVKVPVLSQERNGFDVALLPIVSLPTGADAFSSGGVDPTMKFTWSRDLPHDFGLSGNVNVSSLTAGPSRVLSHALSVSLGHQLRGGWGGYVEAFSIGPEAPRDPTTWTLNGGVSRPVGRSAQIDAEVGRGIGASASQWFVGGGVALRGRWR